MTIAKSGVQRNEPRTNLLARYPLTFYFIIALGGTWIVWSLFVLSQDGAGLLPFRSPTSFMPIKFPGQVFGPAKKDVTSAGFAINSKPNR